MSKGFQNTAKVRDTAGELPLSAGNALRHQLFNKITPILLGSDRIADSGTRLMIQASCLDLVTIIEDLIAEYDLDDSPRARTGTK